MADSRADVQAAHICSGLIFFLAHAPLFLVQYIHTGTQTDKELLYQGHPRLSFKAPKKKKKTLKVLICKSFKIHFDFRRCFFLRREERSHLCLHEQLSDTDVFNDER